MISGRDIICLSTQDWTDLWTRKQRFMQRFARQGNRVLYVETQASLISAGLLRNDPARALRWLHGPRMIEQDLYVATLPLVLPLFQMSRAINGVNNLLLAPLLRCWMARLGFRSPILWTYTPYSESLVGRLGESTAIYDCVDEFAASRGMVRRATVEAQERRLLSKVDAVVVTHENLRTSKRRAGRPVYLIPNGAEIEHFAAAADAATPLAARMKSIARPVVGFLGSVQYWIDFDLLHTLALARPRWSFVLIGPIGRLADISMIDALPNVHLLGRQPYAELPTYLKGFDVCLNPYRRDEVAANCSPLKLYEYLATGKPIVSVEIPTAREFDGVISIAGSAAEMLAQIDGLLTHATDEGRVARMAAAAPHSWQNRFRDLEAAIEPHLTSAGARS